MILCIKYHWPKNMNHYQLRTYYSNFIYSIPHHHRILWFCLKLGYGTQKSYSLSSYPPQNQFVSRYNHFSPPSWPNHQLFVAEKDQRLFVGNHSHVCCKQIHMVVPDFNPRFSNCCQWKIAMWMFPVMGAALNHHHPFIDWNFPL